MVIRFIVRVVAAIIVVVVLAGIIAVGMRTYVYMHNHNFDFGTAIKWAWEDLLDTVRQEKIKNNDIESFEFTNKYIDVIACTALP